MPPALLRRLRAATSQEALSSAIAALSLPLAASRDGQYTIRLSADTEGTIRWYSGGLHRVRQLCQDGALRVALAQFLDYACDLATPAD